MPGSGTRISLEYMPPEVADAAITAFAHHVVQLTFFSEDVDMATKCRGVRSQSAYLLGVSGIRWRSLKMFHIIAE